MQLVKNINSLARFNTADKTLAAVFIAFLVCLALKMVFPGSIIVEGAMFIAEAALVGGIADWFAVTALFKKPLGIPWHTALLPSRRKAFTVSCVKMLQTEFLSRKKIYKWLCGKDILGKGLKYLSRPENKEYFIHVVIDFLVERVQKLDVDKAAHMYYPKIAQIMQHESMHHLSQRMAAAMIKSKNSEAAINRCLALLTDYFEGSSGRGRILSFVEAYQRRYTKNGLGGLMLSIALATNTLDPEELADVIHQRLNELLAQAADPESEIHIKLVEILDESLLAFDENEDWIENLGVLQSDFVQNGALERVIANTIRNFCNYFLATSGEGNKLHMAITHILSDEIDKCMEEINRRGEFREYINGYVMDIIHRAAIKGEGAILDMAQNFLEGLSDDQLNELIYSKVETDMIWIRLNGSIVGAVIGAAAFIIMELAK